MLYNVCTIYKYIVYIIGDYCKILEEYIYMYIYTYICIYIHIYINIIYFLSNPYFIPDIKGYVP